MSRPVLLDSSFLIALDREARSRDIGPARRYLSTLRARPLVVSVVTVAELLEGASDPEATAASLQRFAIQGIHLTHAHRRALLQRRSARRLGENEAWLVSTVETLDAEIVGRDRRAFERLGSRYLRFDE